MKLAVTIDVEEEGLFSGNYEEQGIPVKNLAGLSLLDPIFREHRIRPTLLVSHQAAVCRSHGDIIMRLTRDWGGEVGAHLHPWNTPPFESLPYPEPVPSDLMPVGLLEAKLETLFSSLAAMGASPVSFRMGRFNLGPKMLGVLEKSPIRVDSSIAPMRRYYGGPDHLSAPTDPYFPDPAAPHRPGSSGLLEAPLTIIPMLPGLGAFFEGLDKMLPGGPKTFISRLAQHVFSLPVQPLWTGLRRLQAAVRLHQRRGGRVLTVFFHSSELMPGGCPQHKTIEDVHLFLDKLGCFFGWLNQEITVESLTLSELGRSAQDFRQETGTPASLKQV